MPKVTCPPTTLTLRAGTGNSMQMRGRRCAYAAAPCVPCIRDPDTAAKTPCKKPSSTSTTAADTSAAAPSCWVHLDVVLRRMSGAARRRGRRRRSRTACRKRGASAQKLARALEEQRTARPLQALSAMIGSNGSPLLTEKLERLSNRARTRTPSTFRAKLEFLTHFEPTGSDFWAFLRPHVGVPVVCWSHPLREFRAPPEQMLKC